MKQLTHLEVFYSRDKPQIFFSLSGVAESKVYSVVLNDFDDDRPMICLNSELVSKGYANSTGNRYVDIQVHVWWLVDTSSV